jgi:drug/metabolite transporter (DMT)-like permease
VYKFTAIQSAFDRISDTWKGIGFMAVSGMAFVGMHAAVKSVSDVLPAFEVAFFRALIGFLVLSPLLLTSGLRLLATNRPKLHAIRGLINGISMLCFFTGVTMTPLAELTALSFTAPIFATVLAMLFLGEKVGPRRWAAIMVGFAGTVVILRPGLIDITLGPVLILSAAMIWAIALMLIKMLTRTESSVTITMYASLWLTAICVLPAAWVWVWPAPIDYVWLLLIGCLGTLGQTTMNQSLKLANASAVLPVEFTKLIWAALLGFMLFAEVPDMFTWIGAVLIFGSTTYIGIREAYLRRVATARKAAIETVDPAASSAHKPSG